MGTSTSQASPDTTSWRAVQAMYRADFPTERVVREVWRAAMNDAEAAWPTELSSPSVAICLELASGEMDAAVAVERAGRIIALEHRATFVNELAKLALADALVEPHGRDRFVRHLFEQVTEYLVSRDLSGFIGPRYRNKTVVEAAEFRRRVRTDVGERVGTIRAELGSDDRDSWPATVGAITRGLAARAVDAR